MAAINEAVKIDNNQGGGDWQHPSSSTWITNMWIHADFFYINLVIQNDSNFPPILSQKIVSLKKKSSQ